MRLEQIVQLLQTLRNECGDNLEIQSKLDAALEGLQTHIPPPQEPSFTGINYNVCLYCKHICAKTHWYDGSNTYFCEAEGKLDPIGYDGSEIVAKGCDKFQACERPIHPRVLKELLLVNPLIASVRVDETYTDTSWNFTQGRYSLKLI